MTVELHRMANGVRVVTEHMPGLGSASVGVWVNAGGRHERADQNGIAHFLEHMAFKGTKTRNALQIAEAIEDVGGYINAYTSREMTAYYARVLAEDAGLALDVISDIVLNPIFEGREIEVERHVILQEIGQALDTPDDIIFDWLQETAFPEQPLGRTILGPAERVERFGADDLSRFVSERYAPGNIIVAAAGGVDHDAIVRASEAAFGHLPAHDGGSFEPAAFRGGECRVEKGLEQAHFALAFETPGYRDEAVWTAQLFATAFGGGMSSRLFQEAREKRGLCYTIFSQIGAYSDSGLLTIYAGTSGEELGDLAHLTIDELKRSADDMTPAEVARARAQMKAGLLMGLESPSSRAERMARLLAIWDRVPAIDETVAHIDAVTTGDVRDFVAGLVETGRPAMALYGPVSGAPEIGRLAERLAA
ncbi:insulinase family protein [Alphaproteobacteria bacterium GH1-50]|uniref:Insulinase family protein n=1 Tax=Kangsaoukella pontilimi TaxID=2691042 RepID=A0A7C9IHK8_9RHOB|nr:pitrilysin family protein [Kangsaoukella pontilimi]MXQ08769.1 insulinase family protein [Kangsaoukella pontilimi]